MIDTSSASFGASSSAQGTDTFNIMVVDDSAVIRGLTTRFLETDTKLKVITSASNGEIAVKQLEKYKDQIDVIILDIEMPVMDGITAIPLLLEISPNVRIIMSSTLTLKNAEISMRALSAGASDYVPKPTSTTEMTAADEFRLELIHKVKALASSAKRLQVPPETPRRSTASTVPAPAAPAPVAGKLEVSEDVMPVEKGMQRAPLKPADGVMTTQQPRLFRPKLLAVGSSTGGPQALLQFFKNLPQESASQPIVVTQHMPPTFTSILCKHISEASGWPAKEGENGDILKPGHVYLAPGGYHMLLKKGPTPSDVVVQLDDGPQENYCRPAVDPMLRSAMDIYGADILTVILTGMGQDGWQASKTLVEIGGRIIAQDEDSSVVWGMPGAVANDGLCSDILPLDSISRKVSEVLQGGGI